MNWNQFLKTALTTFFAAIVIVFAFIVLMNPFGNLPNLGLWDHAIMSSNQRFHFPAIVRSRKFDSAVFGTSSSRLLNPNRLGQGLDGKFAILSMDSATPWEQHQLASLFLRHTKNPRTLLIAVDWVWCEKRAGTYLITPRGFPKWMYDETPWNDWWALFNGKTLEIAALQTIHRFGLHQERIPLDGYHVFVPPETEYDLIRARKYIWRGRTPNVPPSKPAYEPSQSERQSWQFPALPWLDELLKMRPDETRAIVAFMPGHLATQAKPGTRQAARINECKARAAEIATSNGAHFLDFWIRSPITMNDENYWDRLHYRVPIANRIVDGIIGAATSKHTQSPDFNYAKPRAPTPAQAP